MLFEAWPDLARLVFMWHYGGTLQVGLAPMFPLVHRYVVMCHPMADETRHFNADRIAVYLLLSFSFSVLFSIALYLESGTVIYEQLRQAHQYYNYSQPLDNIPWRIAFGKNNFMQKI